MKRIYYILIVSMATVCLQAAASSSSSVDSHQLIFVTNATDYPLEVVSFGPKGLVQVVAPQSTIPMAIRSNTDPVTLLYRFYGKYLGVKEYDKLVVRCLSFSSVINIRLLRESRLKCKAEVTTSVVPEAQSMLSIFKRALRVFPKGTQESPETLLALTNYLCEQASNKKHAYLFLNLPKATSEEQLVRHLSMLANIWDLKVSALKSGTWVKQSTDDVSSMSYSSRLTAYAQSVLLAAFMALQPEAYEKGIPIKAPDIIKIKRN